MPISQRTLQLAADFIAAYPIMPGHPGMEHIKLSSDDLDTFGMAQGIYGGATSSPELNDARNKMVARLNKAGLSKVWLINDLGFQIVVEERIGGMPTIWTVKPIEVAMSHATFALPERNRKTIVYRALKVDRMYGAVNMNALPREERNAITDERNVAVGMAQLQVTIAQNQSALLQKTRARLERKDPKHRLLPK
jgi:hypothetical protein